MKHTNFIALCKSQNWEELTNFLGSSILDLSTKILASAVISTHHPDQKMRGQYGLSVWNDKLIDHPLDQWDAAIYGSLVSLNDFYKAHKMATNGFNESNPGLNDLSVAEQISNYVQKNKAVLAAILVDPNFPKAYKQKINESFGNLSISAEEKLAHQKQQIAAQQKKEEAERLEREQIELDNELRHKLGQKIENLLYLEKGSCKVFKEQKEPPVNYVGINNVDKTELEKYAVTLKTIGLDVDRVRFSLMYEEHLINFNTPPAQTLKDLEKYEAKSKISVSPQASPRLFSNSEYAKKHSSTQTTDRMKTFTFQCK